MRRFLGFEPDEILMLSVSVLLIAAIVYVS